MNSYTKLIVLGLFIFSSSCGGEADVSGETIVINPHEATPSILLSEFVDSVYYIKLETSEDCLMGQLREVIIREKYIYVVDNQQEIVFVFDKTGTFVSKLDKKGESPTDYAAMGFVFVSEDELYIEVIDDSKRERSRMIKYSNISFEYLGEHPIAAPLANSSRRSGDYIYFSTQQLENVVDNEVTNADIIVVKDDKVQKALFKKRIATNGNTFSPNVESFTVNDTGDIFVSLMYSNAFFRLTGMKADPVLAIDFGNYGIDNSIGRQRTEVQMEYLQNETEGLASFPVLNAYNADMTAFSYYFKETSGNKLYQYLDFKKSNKVFHAKELVNDLTEFPKKVQLSSYLWAIRYEVMHEGYLVEVILPWHELEGKEGEFDGLGSVKAEDNPIILLMKPKAGLM